MLNQGLTQERVGDVSMSQLPPHNTLPQWSHVNSLDKARYPKPFLKDKLQPLEPRKGMEGDGGEDQELELSGMNPSQRVHYLERSLHFLRQQHSDVLRALHAEVEKLKRENKDLQHNAVMIQKSQHHQGNNSSPLSSGDVQPVRSKHMGGGSLKEEGSEDVKVIFLEEEIKELKHALRESRIKNSFLQQHLEQSEDACKRQRVTLDSLKQQQTSQGGGGSGGGGGGSGGHSGPGQDVPLMMSHSIGGAGGPHPAGGPSQPQSLDEYHAVIRQLQQVNERQAHELESLKSDLRDVLYSHKWTPDAYLLAKAYVSEDDKKGSRPSATSSKNALPKISIRDRSQPLSEVAVIQDSASLPALRHSVGNKAMERRKRVQLMKKDKLKKQTLPE